MTEPGHNVLAGGRLTSLVERVERVEAEIKGLQEGRSDIYAEAKSDGLDVKTLRKIVAIRKQDKAKREEAEAILASYLAAMGMPA